MSTIDRQRVAAVNTLVELGFAFRDGAWHPPLSTPLEAGEIEKVWHMRPALNAVLILSDQLAHNADGNLSPKQVEFARTIHRAGTEVIELINDILEMSKLRSGTVC
jgi:hypothetical protein